MNRIVFLVRAFCIAVVACVLLASAGGAANSVGPAQEIVSQSTSVVARIDDYRITREDVAKRLLQEMRPREGEFQRQAEPVTAQAVLRKLLAEKAASMEGRRLGYLKDEQIHTNLVQFEQQQLAGKLLQAELGGKLTIEDSEIDRVMKDNPKATREQAMAFVQRMKVTRLREQYYAQVTAKRGLKKMSESFATVAQIHQRLLTQPAQPRGANEYWIRNSQLVTDLTEEERNMPLAVYEGGQFTLKDWFQTLCNIAPPRRPKDLDKPEGVQKLLDQALQLPVFAAEAQSQGYDKDPELRSAVKALEDRRLLYKVQEVMTKDVKEPTPEQVKECFDKDPERFATSAVLKADQIWCPDEETARKVKGMLEQGADFQAVKKEHSLQKNVEVYSLSAGGEGLFWADLWKGEPNQILGPTPGFYGSGAKWRIVKVIEKTPAKAQPFSEQLASTVKWAIFSEQRQQAIKDHEQELLAKYPHEVFSDHLQGLDPLEIAMRQPDE